MKINHIITFLLVGIFSIIIFISCKKTTEKPPSPSPSLTLPTVTTSPAKLIDQFTCISGGNVINDGGDSVTECGICYNNLPVPTINNNKIISGRGNGIFVSTLKNLMPNSSYYIRAYAINSIGVGYGEQMQIQTQAIDSAKLIFIGGANKFYCFNARNGNLLWYKTLGNGWNYNTPCYSKGIVYTMSSESVLYAFDTTGILKWSAKTGTSTDEISSPIVFNNTVFINSNNSIFAFDATTGILKWQFTAAYAYTVIGSLTVANNTIYADYAGITAFNPETGSILWSKYIQNRNTKPKIENNKVYGVFDYQLNIADANNGNVILTTGYISTADPISINVAYGNIYVYKEDGLRVFDDLTGSLKWSKGGLGGYFGFIGGGSSPVIKDSLVHLVNGGRVTVYNALTGKQVSNYGSNINDADVTVVNGFSYYGTRDIYNRSNGYLYATGILPDGTIANSGWKSTVAGDFTTTPCVVTDSDKMYRAGDSY